MLFHCMAFHFGKKNRFCSIRVYIIHFRRTKQKTDAHEKWATTNAMIYSIQFVIERKCPYGKTISLSCHLISVKLCASNHCRLYNSTRSVSAHIVHSNYCYNSTTAIDRYGINSMRGIVIWSQRNTANHTQLIQRIIVNFARKLKWRKKIGESNKSMRKWCALCRCVTVSYFFCWSKRITYKSTSDFAESLIDPANVFHSSNRLPPQNMKTVIDEWFISKVETKIVNFVSSGTHNQTKFDIQRNPDTHCSPAAGEREKEKNAEYCWRKHRRIGIRYNPLKLAVFVRQRNHTKKSQNSSPIVNSEKLHRRKCPKVEGVHFFFCCNFSDSFSNVIPSLNANIHLTSHRRSICLCVIVVAPHNCTPFAQW